MKLEEEILKLSNLLGTNILSLPGNIRVVIDDNELVKEIDKVNRKRIASIERVKKLEEIKNKLNNYVTNNTGEWKKLDEFVKGMPSFKYPKIVYLRLPVRLKKDKTKLGYLGKPWVQYDGRVRFKYIGSGRQWDTRPAEDYEVFISDKAETKIIGMALDLAKK